MKSPLSQQTQSLLLMFFMMIFAPIAAIFGILRQPVIPQFQTLQIILAIALLLSWIPFARRAYHYYNASRLEPLIAISFVMSFALFFCSIAMVIFAVVVVQSTNCTLLAENTPEIRYGCVNFDEYIIYEVEPNGIFMSPIQR